MVGVFTVAVAVIAVTPLVLAAFGTVPMGENYVAVLGFWLYGCTCIAVGMLASALTESRNCSGGGVCIPFSGIYDEQHHGIDRRPSDHQGTGRI